MGHADRAGARLTQPPALLLMVWPWLAALAVVVASTVGAPGRTAAEAADAVLRTQLETLATTAGDTLAAFYAHSDYDPIWLADGGTKADTLLDLLSGSGTHGLEPAHYGLEQLVHQRQSATRPRDRAALELALSQAALTYARDLAAGHTVPSSIAHDLDIHPERPNPGLLLALFAAARDLPAVFRAFAPVSQRYARLRTTLPQHQRIAAAGGWTTVPNGPTLRPGTTGRAVALLRRRLVESGDLATLSRQPDHFDATLEAAVVRFQRRHGLDDDGLVGRKTRAALAVSAQRRVDQIVLNLERLRWLPRSLGGRYVFANLADFRVHVFDGEDIIFTSRTVVGKPRHRTPVFSDEIRYLEINPFWHVPYSIASREILPELQADSSYLTRKNMVLFGDGRRIDPAEVDWTTISRRQFPYRIRQNPGSGNSLGRIKIMFPNRHSVYLHDTPAKSLFSHSVRAYSHGCVRVENPLALTTVLLEGQGLPWDRAAIDRQVASGQRRVINLPRKIPIHLVYLTAWVDEAGEIQFRDDIYGRDDALRAALHDSWSRPIM